MKKSIRMSVKPLAMATAFAAGTSVSMIATALPGGDTLGAAGVVNESICTNRVDVTVSGGARSIVSAAGDCQLRTLPPTKGLVLAESASAGSNIFDDGAMVPAGGELYEAYVGGNREAAVLLTPNRALMTSRAIEFASGNDGSVSYDMFAAVQPVSGLQASWLTGTYNIVNRNHSFSMVAEGLENSPYQAPNFALGERNYTGSMTVQFNGDGTCDIVNRDSHVSATLTKDPLFGLEGFGEMDVTCFTGGGNCGQNDGNNYIAMGNLNVGSTFVDGSGNASPEADWNDASGDADDNGSRQLGCSYVVGDGHVVVSYAYEYGDLTQPEGDLTLISWSSQYDVSKDLRYLVSHDGNSTDALGSGAGGTPQDGGIAVGVRTGSVSLEGKTYLFNALDANNAASTPSTASYENPASPVYQEEECISRGSLSLAAAGACTINTVNTCSGRFKEGYEETSDGAADGTIVDSLTVFNGAPAQAPSCSWSGSAQALTVNVGVLDQDGNPVTVAYTGSASDNGEALVLQGVYSDPGAGAPDTDNAPLLPQMKYNMISFMVAQQYQGTLSADADADGLNNLAEFQWANDVTPASGTIRSDFDADGDSDILTRQTSNGQYRLFTVQAGAPVGNAYFNAYSSADVAYVAQGDFDGDGDADVLTRKISDGGWRIFTVQNGAVTGSAFTNIYAASAWQYAGIADLNGDGTDDVLVRNTSNGQWRAFYMAAGLVSGNAYFNAYTSTDWVLQGTGDVDADGDDDLLMRATSTGTWRVFSVDAGNVAGSAFFNAYASADTVFQKLADLDGDGDVDLLTRSTSTGQWRNFAIQSGAVTGSTFFNMYASADFNLAAVGDFSADGSEDVILRNAVTGQYRLFNVSAGAVTGNSFFNLYASLDHVVKQ